METCGNVLVEVYRDVQQLSGGQLYCELFKHRRSGLCASPCFLGVDLCYLVLFPCSLSVLLCSLISFFKSDRFYLRTKTVTTNPRPEVPVDDIQENSSAMFAALRLHVFHFTKNEITSYQYKRLNLPAVKLSTAKDPSHANRCGP